MLHNRKLIITTNIINIQARLPYLQKELEFDK